MTWPKRIDDASTTTGRSGDRPLLTAICVALVLTVSAHAQLYAPMGEAVGTLVRDGQASGAIVVAAEASEHEQAAAQELATYLQRISGAEVPVAAEGEGAEGYAAFLGWTDFARGKGLIDRAEALGDEGLLMYADEDGMALLGPDDLGTYNAVYAFLEEKLGVRWFNPDPLGEVVPEMATVEIGRMDETQTPDLQMRWIGRGEWALRSRQNVGLPDPNLGLKIFRSAHTFRSFLPPDELFDEHPEWFAQVGGRRQIFEGHHRNQICTSNPKAIDATVAAMRKMLDEDPDLDIITLFPNDGAGFCECDACRALDEDTQYTVDDVNSGWAAAGWEKHRTLSRRMTIFYAECARQIMQSHPDRWVKTGIYASYLLTPLDETLEMPPNSTGQLCHGWCHNHRIDDPNCEINVDFKKSLDGWGDIYPSLCLYEYYYKVAALELPFPIIHAMRHDIPFLRDEGVFGIYTQYAQNWWTIGLNYYVASRLVWDADLDVDALLADYYERMYAETAAPMREYHEAYEQAAIEADVHLSCDYAQLPLVFSDELIAAQRERLGRAMELAQSEAVRERIAKQQIVIGYVDVAMAYMDAIIDAAEEHASARWVTSGDPDEELEAKAQQVREYLEGHLDSNCFRDRVSNYVERFLTPANALRDTMPYVMEATGELTKPEWLEQTGHRAEATEMPETFAIWLYANDIDGSPENPEHELRLQDADGEFVRVAGIPDEGAREANRVNAAYVVGGLSTERFIRDGTLTLHFANLPEDWYMSTVYAFFVMPEFEGVTDAQATRLIEGDLDRVRGASAGFHEYAMEGIPSGEGAPIEVTIDVSGGFPRVELGE